MPLINPKENIPDKQSSATEWIQWHGALKSRYGKKTANQLFIEAWSDRGSSDANTTDLREYAEKEGMSIEGGTFSFVSDFASEVGDQLAFGFGVAKWLYISIIVVVISLVIYIVYKAMQDPQAIGAAVGAVKGGGRR